MNCRMVQHAISAPESDHPQRPHFVTREPDGKIRQDALIFIKILSATLFSIPKDTRSPSLSRQMYLTMLN